MNKALIPILTLMIILAVLSSAGLSINDAIFIGYVSGFITAAWILPAIGKWLRKGRGDK